MTRSTKAKTVATLVILMGAWVCVPNLSCSKTAEKKSTERLSAAKVDPALVANLIEAAQNGTASDIQALLKAGAEVKARNEDEVTGLMGAAGTNPNPEVITALFKAGAEVNTSWKDGTTALMFAAQMNSHPEVITALLEAGADAKAKDDSGMSALDYAKENKKLNNTDAYWKLNDASH